MIKTAPIYAAIVIGFCSGTARADDSALLADYLHGMDMDQMYANLDQSSSTKPGHVPPLDLSKAQMRYKHTLQLVKSDPERRALLLHWAQMQTCADLQQKELSAEAEDRLDYVEWRSRADQCNTELAQRAADVKASARMVVAVVPTSKRPTQKR